MKTGEIQFRRTTGITEPERLTLRKSKMADRGLRVHAIVLRFIV